MTYTVSEKSKHRDGDGETHDFDTYRAAMDYAESQLNGQQQIDVSYVSREGDVFMNYTQAHFEAYVDQAGNVHYTAEYYDAEGKLESTKDIKTVFTSVRNNPGSRARTRAVR